MQIGSAPGEWEICLHIFTAQSSSSALRRDSDVAQVVKAALSAGRQEWQCAQRLVGRSVASGRSGHLSGAPGDIGSSSML